MGQGEGILDFDPQTRVENAMRDLIRIEAILNEILDFAKPLELTRRLIRIPEVIESALTLITTDLEVTRIQVTKDYATIIAPVRGDEAKLQQVFLSIFKNACEAMNPGGHLHIQVTQHRAGRGVEDHILIKNDGVPIPAEIVDKVFEPFFTTKRAGIGLGLATVKKIVEEHGGSIAIGSAPGEGTTVTIRLPGPAPARPIAAEAAAGLPHAAQPSVPFNWLVWLVSFLWLIERNEADEPNELEKPVLCHSCEPSPSQDRSASWPKPPVTMIANLSLNRSGR